jgi:hypothetical protein
MTVTHSRFSGDFLYDCLVHQGLSLAHLYSSCQQAPLGVLFGPPCYSNQGLQSFSSGILKSLGINLNLYLCVDLRMSLWEPVDYH